MPEEKEDLQIVMKASDILRKGDFETSFKKVLELVLQIQKNQQQAMADLRKTYEAVIQRLQNDHNDNYSKLRGQVDEVFVGDKVNGMTKEHTARMAATDKKLAEAEEKIKSLKNGYTPKKGIDYNDGKPGKDGRLIASEEVRNKLESLRGDERLDKTAIKGLEEMIKEKVVVRGGGGPNANAVQFADLSSQCTGSNKTFTTPKYRYALLLISTQFPVLYKPTTDFAIGNGQIILTDAVVAPASDQTFIFLYIK